MVIVKEYKGLAETSTVPVIFAPTSTLGAAVSWATTSTMNVKWNITSTLGAAVSVAANQTGTIPVVFNATSTVTLATTSTVAIGVSGSVSLVGVLTSLNQITGTIGVVRAGLTTTTATQPISGTVSLGITNATIPTSFSTGSTVQAQPMSKSTTTTSTAFNVTTTAATLVASNANRIFCGIRNLGRSLVLLMHVNKPSTTSYDLYLNQDDYYEINQNNLFTGVIQIIASTLTSTVTVIEV